MKEENLIKGKSYNFALEAIKLYRCVGVGVCVSVGEDK